MGWGRVLTLPSRSHGRREEPARVGALLAVGRRLAIEPMHRGLDPLVRLPVEFGLGMGNQRPSAARSPLPRRSPASR